jgi:hypothetical protein
MGRASSVAGQEQCRPRREHPCLDEVNIGAVGEVLEKKTASPQCRMQNENPFFHSAFCID